MAKPSARVAPIVKLLQEKELTFKEIADSLGVSLNVVLGVNSVYKRGNYAVQPSKNFVPFGAGGKVRTDRGWTYMLVSRCGVVYIGASTDIRRRFRQHNSVENKGWTRGRQWHLLGVKRFSSRSEAFEFEASLKSSGSARGKWQEQCVSRASKLERKFDLGKDWLNRIVGRAQSLQRNDSRARLVSEDFGDSLGDN